MRFESGSALVTRIGYLVLPGSSARCPVVPSHLRGMDETPSPLDRSPMWTVEELSAKLHASPETLRTWRKRGAGPRAYKVGRHVLYAEADVRAWLDSHELPRSHSRTPVDDGSGW